MVKQNMEGIDVDTETVLWMDDILSYFPVSNSMNFSRVHPEKKCLVRIGTAL